MALMFFPDGAAALREMGRVSAASGTVAVLVPSDLDDNPRTARWSTRPQATL